MRGKADPRVMRIIRFSILIAAALITRQDLSWAQEYPQRPVRFIVPYPPGGGADTLVRIITRGLSARWKEPIVVDNRPGGDATIGVQLAATAPPDGHTLVLIITSHAVHPSLKKLPYDLIRDFAPVSNILEGPAILLTNPALKAANVQELIAMAKARDGQLTFAGSGVGGPGHLSGIMFNYLAGVKTTHIPYKGGLQAITALIGGEVDFMFATVLSGMPHVKSGRMRALAVTSAQRSSFAPELPTVIESGLGTFESTTWYGVLTRGGTPVPIVEKIHADMLAVVQTPEVAQTLTAQGVQIVGMPPRQFAAHLQSEIRKWAVIVKQANMQDMQNN